MDQQGHCAILGQTIDPLHRGFTRIVEGVWESKRRISEIQIAVRFEHEIVRTVNLVSIVVVGERYDRSIRFQPPDLSVAVASEDETTLGIKRESV